MLHHSVKNPGGFSLAEAMLAVVILGMAASVVLLPFATSAAIQAEGRNRTLSAILASDLVEIITTTSFDEIIDAYDGYYEMQGQMKDVSGAVFTDSNYANFSRNVTCEYVRVSQESEEKQAKFILVTVRVYYKGSEIAIMNKLISG
ncbi:hypothetical protein ACFL1G_07880 [Planctomycetota bacterium]